ncbi:MAG: DUF4388 domain-containing protein [Deltaproteobacteria bacterium]|nr:DUF4388 domain-containing protein [Deltaproteobacteria bacterium]MBW2698202.1 DUF4388 domain-containing protein [Deltaproteobacteria bacterium]
MDDILAKGELILDAEQREQLGLDPTESLRVLHRTSHLIALERTGEHGGAAVPWDRDLVLTADVRAFPLADLLSMVHAAGKSGFLLLSHGDHEKTVFLHRGEVVFASSNQRVDRLGECLLRGGKITLEQLHEADKRWSPTTRFGKVLVELGMLTPRDLWNTVKTQVEEIVRSLFAYTAGTVHFWEGEVQPDNIVRLALPTQRLIAEGLKRRDELFKFLALLEDPRTRLSPLPDMDARLSASERTLVRALMGEGTFPTVCRQVGVDPLSGARTVQLLQLVGAVRIDRDEKATGPKSVSEPDPRSHEDDRVRECVYDHVKLLAELAAPIVAVDGAEAVAERLGRILEETAERHTQVLGGLVLGHGGVLDPEQVLGRALRLAGDRVRGVSQALGELVTYLEFELNNHPRIEGAASFLDAVEELRSKIEC